MFSPYYAWAGRRDPLNHCSLNVVLYGDGWSRWAMTERGRWAIARGPLSYQVGPSVVAWEGDRLVIDVAERSVPHLAPLRGRVTLHPGAMMREAYALDAPERHWWRPVAPTAEIEVAFDRPDFRWRGAGYFDMNWGAEPLEDGFQRWDWSRAPMAASAAGAAAVADGATSGATSGATTPPGAVVLYDATRRDGSDLTLALRFDGRGGVTREAPPPAHALPSTLYRVKRRTLADAEARPTVHRRYEDAPFYARAELRTRLFGHDVAAMHETLDLDRFRSPWVKRMLPFRMPRVPV